MSNTEGNRASDVPQWTLGDRLAKARRYAEVTRDDMAEYLGLSPQALSNYESDKRPVKIQTIRLWALRCGVPLEWLQHGDTTASEHPTPPSGGGEQDIRESSCIHVPLRSLPHLRRVA